MTFDVATMLIAEMLDIEIPIRLRFRLTTFSGKLVLFFPAPLTDPGYFYAALARQPELGTSSFSSLCFLSYLLCSA